MQSSCATAAPPVPQWHAGFLAMLPAIQSHARRASRRLSASDREEAVQAVVALAAIAYARLVRQGCADQAYAAPLAKYAVKQYRAGRLAGGRVNSRDVGSRSCQRRGCVVEALDQCAQALCDSRRANPAETAAIRIDLSEWLQTLTPRDRRVVWALATGEPAGRVAEMFRLTAGRVSQLRCRLAESWRQFVGDPVPAAG